MTRVLLALCAVAPLVARAATVDVSEGFDALSGGRPSWRSSAVEATWTGEAGAAVGGGLRELSRFDREDADGALWAQAPLGGFVVGAEGSASPTWRFVPRWSAGLRAERGLGAGWVASLGGRVARFEGDFGRATPGFASAGLERYWGRWRAAAVTTAVVLQGGWSGSERLALDLFYGDTGRVGVSLAAGRELESLGAGQLLRTDVRSAAIVGAHPVTAGWALTWELSVQRQGDLYTRTGGRLGLRRRF